MKPILPFFCSLGLILVCSCIDRLDNDYTRIVKENEVSSYEYLMNNEELMVFASETIPSLFNFSDLTKSSGKEVESILPIKETKWKKTMKSVVVQSLYDDTFIINYKNNNGFAIINADKRLDQVLAYSDNGTIKSEYASTSNMHFFPSFGNMYGDFTIDDILDLLPYYYEWLAMYLIPWPDFQLDSLDSNGYYYCNPEYYYSTPISLEERYASTGATWGGGSPYNTAFEIMYDDESSSFFFPYAGCVTIAIGQIMKKYAFPTSTILYGTAVPVSLNWESYSMQVTSEEDSTRALTSLLRDVAIQLQSVYKPSGTYAAEVYIKPALSHYGYTFDNSQTNNMESYSIQGVRSSIESGYPVIVSGYENNNADNLGHCWLVEGYRRILKHRLVDWDVYDPNMQYCGRWTTISPNDDQLTEYVLCNWGLDGQYNGWFISYLFNPGNLNYSYNTKMITGVHH